jgi:hypothetical protein
MCVCVCVCVCLYICMYVCMCMCLYILVLLNLIFKNKKNIFILFVLVVSILYQDPGFSKD